MNSSISNFKKQHISRRKEDERYWPLLFLSVFFCLIVLIALFNFIYAGNAKLVREMQERQLMAHKIFASRKYRILFAGSSRFNFGVDPDSMREALPGFSIGNCAMFGGALNREILTFLDQKKLDRESPGQKIVVLEFSSRVFWASLRNNASYLSTRSKSPDEIQKLLNYSAEKRFSAEILFMPMSRSRWNMRKEDAPGTPTPVYHPDTGWYQIPNPTGEMHDDYVRRKKSMERARKLWTEIYSPEPSFQEMLEQTRLWRKENILVVGIAPPLSPQVRELEEKASGFNGEERIRAFERAGGIFLPVPGDFPPTLNTHLDSETARRYSRAVARELRALLDSRK